jgi:hypothetical protein
MPLNTPPKPLPPPMAATGRVAWAGVAGASGAV